MQADAAFHRAETLISENREAALEDRENDRFVRVEPMAWRLLDGRRRGHARVTFPAGSIRHAAPKRLRGCGRGGGRFLEPWPRAACGVGLRRSLRWKRAS